MNTETLYGLAFASVTMSDVDPLHPFQRVARFIFTDFSPNANNFGVPRHEAENVLNTGLFMPVKINFSGDKPNKHANTQPIGPIVRMYLEGDQIIGEAVIWAREVPDVVEYMETHVDGVQFSWEIGYTDAVEDEDGVRWLQDCAVAAITVVDTPAYRGRTHLLSIAEEDNEQTAEDTEIAACISDEVLMTETTETTEVVIPDDVLAELEELRAYRQNVEATIARTQRLDARLAELTSAGVTFASEDLNALREEFILTLSDDHFAFYVRDLRAAQSTTVSTPVEVSEASETNTLPDTRVPDSVIGETSTDTLSRSDLIQAIRSNRLR